MGHDLLSRALLIVVHIIDGFSDTGTNALQTLHNCEWIKISR